MDGAARTAVCLTQQQQTKRYIKYVFLQTLYKWLGLFAIDATGD
jgi:hypothetical protein